MRWLYLIICVSYCQGRYFRENKTQERPCVLTLLDPTKKYCDLCVLSQSRNLSIFGMRFISELAYLRRRSLSSRHWFGCGLVFEKWGGLYVGKESRSVETHVLVSRRNFPLIRAFWCCESYLVGKQLYSLYCACLIYQCSFGDWHVRFLPWQHVCQFLGTLRLRHMA